MDKEALIYTIADSDFKDITQHMLLRVLEKLRLGSALAHVRQAHPNPIVCH